MISTCNLSFAKLKHDSLQTNLLPQSLTLQEMGHEIFNLIRSFSFVGEISESAEDYQLAPSTLGASSLTDDHPVEPRNGIVLRLIVELGHLRGILLRIDFKGLNLCQGKW